MGRDGKIKPIGWKPDGTHVNKGSLFLVVAILIGLYCMFSPAPFGHDKTPQTTTEIK